MSTDQLSKYSAKIKDVYIELKDYRFFHSPYSKDKDVEAKQRFIGRNKVKDRIMSILGHTEIRSGSYLITGFRGMGKTSVVREAIFDHNNLKNSKEQKNRKNDSTPLSNTHKDKKKDYFKKFIKIIKILSFYILSFIFVQHFFNDFVKIFSDFNWESLILLVPVLHILLSLSFSKVFEVTWDFSKIIMVLFLFIFLGNFFIDYKSENSVLEIKFIDSFSIFFRLLLSIIISFIILSAILFLVDLISLILKSFYARFNAWLLSKKNADEPVKYESFEINLSQDSLSEMDVLRRMTIALEEYC